MPYQELHASVDQSKQHSLGVISMYLSKHKTIQYLVKDFSRNSSHKAVLRQNRTDYNVFALMAPIATALIIEKTQLKPKVDGLLKVLVVGASGVDAMRHGCYYQMVPEILGQKDLNIDITLVGEDLETQPPLNGLQKAKMYQGRFESFASRDLSEFDLAVFFHPGYESHHQSWLVPKCLMAKKKLLESGVTVVGTSYDEKERDVDILILQQAGFDASSTFSNPFLFNLAEKDALLSTEWGHEMWVLANDKTPEDGFEVNMNAIESILNNNDRGFTTEDVAFDYAKATYEKTRSLDKVYHYVAQSLVSHLPIQERERAANSEHIRDMAGNMTMRVAQHFGVDVDDDDDIDINNVLQSLLNNQQSDAENGVSLDALNNFFGSMLEENAFSRAEAQPFFEAIRAGRLTDALNMLQNDPELANDTDDQGFTSLGAAAIVHDSQSLMSGILQANPELINQRDNEGFTAITEAAKKGHTSNVKFLLEAGANPNMFSNMGWNALMTAITSGKDDSIIALLDAGADPDLPTHFGCTIRELALQNSGSLSKEVISRIKLI